MSALLDGLTIIFVSVGCFFFLTGVMGLFRLPDIYCRLHALTKADNMGLGFVVLGLSLQASNILTVLKLFLVWFIVLIASAGMGTLIGEAALNRGVKPWKS